MATVLKAGRIKIHYLADTRSPHQLKSPQAVLVYLAACGGQNREAKIRRRLGYYLTHHLILDELIIKKGVPQIPPNSHEIHQRSHLR
jgi:hypothetical protein